MNDFFEKLQAIKGTNDLTHHFVEAYGREMPSAVKDYFFWGIASFTRNKDSEKHWHSYALSGTGVRLGFSSLDTSWKAPHPKQTRMFDYCMHYDKGMIHQDQEGLVSIIADVLCRKLSDTDPKTALEILKELSISVSPGVIQHALFYKKEAFSWEDEVRVLIAGDIKYLKDLIQIQNSRRFIEVPLFPLLDITMGPHVPSDMVKLLEQLAEKYNVPLLKKSAE